MSLKGLSEQVRRQRCQTKIRWLVDLYQPQFVLLEEFSGKRKALRNRLLAGYLANLCMNMGLAVRYISISKVKRALCPGSETPTWQEVINTVIKNFAPSSFAISNLVKEILPEGHSSFEDAPGFRLFPLSDSRRYYFSAISALVLALGYIAVNNEITYETISNTSKEKSAENYGDLS